MPTEFGAAAKSTLPPLLYVFNPAFNASLIGDRQRREITSAIDQRFVTVDPSRGTYPNRQTGCQAVIARTIRRIWNVDRATWLIINRGLNCRCIIHSDATGIVRRTAHIDG